MFNVRAVTIDYYTSKLINEIYEKDDPSVNTHWLEPVIRIFGSTPDGVKTCVHVHGVFPYIYVPYKGGENPDRDALIFGASLDEALKVTYNHQNYRYVYKVTPISGIPLYGYHSGPRQFFKVFFYNPYHIRKASELLLNGVILGEKLQPHEAHIPYILQFMIDYNIYGMSFVSFSKIKYRKDPENPESLAGISEEALLPSRVKRMTYCQLEVDAHAIDIVNKSSIRGLQTNPGLQAIWESEKIRRKVQNRSSQFTAEETHSRKMEKIHATELMYKERLVTKLKNIALRKPDFSKESDEPKLTYPAEVSDNSKLLDASVLDEEVSHPHNDLKALPDISIFINEKILSQIENGGEESAEELEGVEAESILGKNQNQGEEEVELENDDGGEMTQPLDLEKDVVCGSNSNTKGLETNPDVEKFWHGMADKILQIDGAQDSSSDSDAEVALKAKAGNCVLDREHNADLMRCHQSISNESLSNILSVLNDNSTASLPVIVSQTPPTFWSNFSPRMDCSWLPPSQETWSWDKNEVTFTDCFPSRSQAVGLCDFPVAFASKPLEDVNFSESLGNLFASNQFFDNYNSVSTLSPCSNIESNYSNSSLGIPTPSSRFDNYSDINMNLINETSHEIIQSFSDLKGSENQTTTQVKPVKGENTVSPAANVEKKQKTINIKEKILNNAKEVNKKLISDVKQTKTVSLTLKQYLKDFGEIVNVDLKNFSDREMVVVEYKPLHVKSSRSKFLIKPLDKFLENWNIAEKKINDELKEGKKISNAWQITMNQSVVESAKKKMDTEENNLNLLSVDSLESKQKSDRLKASKFKTVNNNVFKSKEITSENNEILKACNKKIQECAKDFTGEKLSIKVKKSRIKNFEESITEESHYVKQAATANNITKNSENDPNANNPLLCRSKNFRKNKLNGTTKANNKKYFKTRDGKNKSDRLSLNNLNENSVQGKKKEMNSRNKTLRNSAGTEGKINSSNIDFKLINQINSCFEDYFKNIVKVNNSCGENVNNFRQNSSEPLLKKNTDGYENHKTSASAQENSNFRKPCDSQSLESVKFVTQLLSIFSQMSKTCEIPPLSITINIGNRSDSESVPVQLNLQNSVNEKVGKGLKGKHKKLKRKLIIPNVDGAADNSSSEDSLENFSDCHPKISKKKIKKDSYYKALNVVLQKSATKEKKELTRKRKLSSTSRMDDNNDVPSDRDCSHNYRKNRLKSDTQPAFSSNSKNKASDKYCESGSVELKNLDDSVSLIVNTESKEEPDIIYDSDDEFRSKKFKSKPCRKKILKFKSKKFLQEIEKTNIAIECPTGEKTASDFFKSVFPTVSQVRSDGANVSGTSGALDTNNSTCVDAPIASTNEAYCWIPQKHSDSIEAGVQCETQSIVKGNSQESVKELEFLPSSSSTFSNVSSNGTSKVLSDSLQCQISQGMPLSGSPLCSPAENLALSTESRDSQNPNFPSVISTLSTYSNSQNDQRAKCQDSTMTQESKLNSSECSSVALTEEVSRKLSRDFSSDSNPKSSLPLLSNSRFSFDSENSNGRKLNPIISLVDSKIIFPEQKPPTRRQIQASLSANNNWKEPTEIPFYGDPRDLTKPMETGPLVLKVESNAVAGLKEFKSGLNICGTEDIRAQILRVERKEIKFRYLLAGDKEMTITPLKKPPCRSTIFKLSGSKSESNKNKKMFESKTKLILPLSPGQESCSEDELEISLSLTTSEDVEHEIYLCSDKQKNLKNSCGSSSEGRSSADSSNAQNCSVSKATSFKKRKIFKRQSAREKLKPISEEPKSSNSGSTDDNTEVLKQYKSSSDNSFQIRGVTLDNTYGFENSIENHLNLKLTHTHQYVTMLVMELHVKTRKDLRPDPELDPIKALFYTVTFDSPQKNQETGAIIVNDMNLSNFGVSIPLVHRVSKEEDLILKLIQLMKTWDPDILAGYEIEMNSWGYLVQRGFVLELNLLSLLGRVRSENSLIGEKKSAPSNETDEFVDVPRSIKNMKISGRIVLDIWRVLRHEVALTSYTFENIMYHLSHERHPLIPHRLLSFYWEHKSQSFRHITVDYYLTRVTGVVKILDRLDFINRTSEFARLFGIQFYEVLSRGSQFRVESMMLRLAKPLNYVAASPSVAQRAAMRAPASLPLILEPESAYYSDPVIVLDFQSLYPSMIIAYNYCFSTCLGRVEELGGWMPFEFGCTQLQISPEELKELENDINISPAGVAFVRANIRKGILPTMLEEILETRLMVKKSMKKNKDNKLLEKVLHAQQLGLKLIANVTYGYTAANFSGRMPCIEVGDSVVSKGRETLHRAIQLVKDNPKWNARVVYGDTDSIFVLTPGKSRAEAFQIGAEIAEAVTLDNPKPVKLKLEKIYQPCILQTKKRYVGYMYESMSQEKPIFDAKGIETVRRDGCPAVGKILQKALQILFDTRDVSLVKKYTIRQFAKLYQGRVNLQDLIFAKEYRGRNGYRPGACVPALQLARQWTLYDKRSEPRVKERVPYVIVNGPPGVPLIKLVRSPMDLISDPSLHINVLYYITKAIIPPMHRCFSLMGVDVASWYSEMPKKHNKVFKAKVSGDQKKSTISQYFSTKQCIICSNVATDPVCQQCQKLPQVVTVGLIEKVRHWERCHAEIAKICQSCCKRPSELDCQSMDCPVLFRRIQASRDFIQVPFVLELLNGSPESSGSFEF